MSNINQGLLDGVRRIGAKVRDLTIDGGITGAPLGLRLRGATQSGPPQTGTWKTGDEVSDRYGAKWVCAEGGTGLEAAWVPSGVQDAIEGPQVFDAPGFTYLIAPSAAYTVLTASGGLTITQDTTDYEWGTQSIKMVTDGGGGSNFATISFSPPLDLSEQCVALGIEIDSFTPYNSFQMRVASDNFVSGNYSYCQPLYTSATQRWAEAGTWEQITVNWGAAAGNMSPGQWIAVGSGVANLKSVNAIRFKLVDNGGSAPMTIRLGYLAYFQRPPKAVITVAFDDSRLTQYTIAKPAMDVYGMRGTVYNIGYNVENAASLGSAYFSQAQLQDLQNGSGWELAAHAFTDTTGVMAHTVGYDSLTYHDGDIDIIQLRNWMRSMTAQGIDDFALPHGQWDLNLSGTVGANANVLGMMSQYFNTCRTTYGNTIETYPPANRAKLRCYVAQSTDTATTIMNIVNQAVANKWWLILVFHNLPATVSGSTDFAAAQFQALIPELAAADAYFKTTQEVMKTGYRPPSGGATPPRYEYPAYVADASYAVTSNNDLVAYTSLTAARVVTLPAVTALSGKTVTVKDETGLCSGTLTITISPPAGATIDGAGSFVLAGAYQGITLYTDGANWFTRQPPSGSLDQIATQYPAGAAVPMNSQKITSLLFGTSANDSMAFGQLPASPAPADLGFLWWTGDHECAATTTLSTLATSGVVYLHSFWIRYPQTLSTISYDVATAGTTLTSGQCFAGVYSVSGTVATLQSATADQSANFGSSGFKTATFVTPYSTATAGRYYTAWMFNGTTSPAFKGSGALASLINGGLSGASLRCAVSSSTGNTTALPSTIGLSGSTSGGSLPIWAAGA